MGQMHNPVLWTKRSVLACSKAIDSKALASGGLGGGNLPSVGSLCEPCNKNRIEGLCGLHNSSSTNKSVAKYGIIYTLK